MPNFVTPIHEFNPNHEPAGSSKGGEFAAATTRVGITSARPAGAPDYRSNRQVFTDMRALAGQLRTLKGVSRVSVTPGVGAWGTGWEPSWIVAYRGNGEARRLLAQTGRAFNQDAVLLMHGCRGTACEPVTEFHFTRPLNGPQRTAVSSQLAALGFGGWTWGKRTGTMVLRVAHVPDWAGMTRADHRARLHTLSVDLQTDGHRHRLRSKQMRPEIFDRSNYDTHAEGS